MSALFLNFGISTALLLWRKRKLQTSFKTLVSKKAVEKISTSRQTFIKNTAFQLSHRIKKHSPNQFAPRT